MIEERSFFSFSMLFRFLSSLPFSLLCSLFPPLSLLPLLLSLPSSSDILLSLSDVKVRRAVRHIARGVSAPIDLAKLTIPHPEKGDEVLASVFPQKERLLTLLDLQIVWSFNSIHWGLASKVNVTAEKLRYEIFSFFLHIR